MKTGVWILSALLLAGCAAKEPSLVMAETAQKEVVAVQETVKRIEKTTPQACKTDALMANLEAISSQVSVLNGQLTGITSACDTEKNVLKEKITTRNVMIGSLIGALFLLAFLLLRRK